jgi:alpha-L-rhamnosidase
VRSNPDTGESPSTGAVSAQRFLSQEKVSRAAILFPDIGWSELYLNGEKVGDAVLSPCLTDYTKRIFCMKYDLTRQLRNGANRLGAILGTGTHYAPRSEVSTGHASFGWLNMWLQMRIEYSDGSRSEVITNNSWQLTTEGPIRANNIHDGEQYDANYDLAAWNNPGYNVTPFLRNTAPDGNSDDVTNRNLRQTCGSGIRSCSRLRRLQRPAVKRNRD